RFIIPRQALLFHLLFFFNAPPPTEIYTLSLHDALPISPAGQRLWSAAAHGPAGLRRRPAPGAAAAGRGRAGISATAGPLAPQPGDRKSTRLNSSHVKISYAVFCLKKKKIN